MEIASLKSFTQSNVKRCLSSCGIVLLAAGFLTYLAIHAWRMELHFDSSYNLLIARTLALSGKYASNNYILPGREYYPFDAWITTGYPVLGPIAAVWKLTGVSYLSARIMMVAWTVVFMFLTLLTIRCQYRTLSSFFLISLLIALFLHLNLSPLAVHTLGEIPAATFLLGVILLFRSQRRCSNAFLLGALLALSTVTKLMMVFAALPLGIVFLVSVLRNERPFLNGVAFCTGAASPFVCQALWIQTQMPLPEWYHLQKVVWATQGVSLDWRSLTSLSHFFYRFLQLGRYDIGYLVAGLFVIYRCLASKRLRRSEMLPIIGLFLFFLLLVKGYHPRHLAMSKYFLYLITALEMTILIDQATKQNWRSALRYGMGFMVGIFLLYRGFSHDYSLATEPSLNKQKKISKILRSRFANATIFYRGWWKAPDIQLLSGLRFIMHHPANLFRCDGLCYIIQEPLMEKLASDQAAAMRRDFGKPVFSKFGYKLYRMK